MSYNLFLDDVRSPNSSWMNYFREVSYDLYDWTVVKDYDEFVRVIDTKGIPEFVSYDHDLHETHYDKSMFEGEEAYEAALKDNIEKTGLECAKYLVSKLNETAHPMFVVHSQNPVGKLRIQNYIKDYNRYEAINDL